MATVHIEIDDILLKTLIKEYLENYLNGPVQDKDISIMVKSKQNYRSEWENARFKAVFTSTLRGGE